jgi:hypothetical protein
MIGHVPVSDSLGQTEVMNFGSLNTTGAPEAPTLPRRASARRLPPELASAAVLAANATAVPAPKRDPFCALCSRPIENGARAVEVAGVRLHVSCAARRRSRLRR